MKKYFALTFDLPLFGPSGINDRPSPLLFADINSCQGKHTQTHLQAKIFTTHLLRNLFTLFTFHLTSLYSGCLYSQ